MDFNSDEERFLDDYYYYNEEDDYEEDEDDPGYSVASSLHTYLRFHAFLPNHHLQLPVRAPVTREEADRNAKELLEQEKKEKEKINKKRLKKKRQKDRKRQQKLEMSTCDVKDPVPDASDTVEAIVTTSVHSGYRKEEKSDPEIADEASATSWSGSVDLEYLTENLSKSDTEDDLDLESTFVRKARKKADRKPKHEKKERSQERAPQDIVQKPKAKSMGKAIVVNLYQIQQSLDLANIGNSMALKQRFADAIVYYTDAIRLNPNEFRFLGNRSYSYERCGKYKEALQDAEQAVSLQPSFIKGFFRKGKALKGLERYEEAIISFKKVLASDMNHTEAETEILQCQLELQAFSNRPGVPSSWLRSPLLSAPGSGIVLRQVVTRPEGALTLPKTKTSIINTMPPTMSKLFPVWVGNVTDKITENILRTTFEPFGPIHSIRILYSRTCAFINYTGKQDAEMAFRVLQGLHVDGTTFVLQLRNPEHSNLNVPGWNPSRV